MTALMRVSIDDAIHYAQGVKEALDQIHELREEGEQVSPADLKRIDELVEDCVMHEALAEFDH